MLLFHNSQSKLSVPNMKFIVLSMAILTFSTLSTVEAQSAKCLYCIYQDTTAGFMSSFSYCSAIDACLEDAWNYIDYKCASKWVKGRKLAIDLCEPQLTECPGFTSKEAAYGIWENAT